MSLNKINYVDNETIITADNLNDIQNNIMENSLSAKLYNMIEIPSGSNLDDYQEIGSYCVRNNSEIPSIINCPVSEAFIMYVINGTGSSFSGIRPSDSYTYYSQYVIPFNEEIIYRRNLHYNSYGMTSSGWQIITYQGAYPVGSIYMSVNDVSPASLFGGTWEQIYGKFLLAANSTYIAGSTGGEATHTLTINEMPSHNHGYKSAPQLFSEINTSDNNVIKPNTSGSCKIMTYTSNNTGGGQAHNNMPPYLAVYMWKRIS